MYRYADFFGRLFGGGPCLTGGVDKKDDETVNKSMRKDLIGFMKSKCGFAQGVLIDPKELVFEENVKMNCFYCGKYNNNWRCPPNLPDIDYPRMMAEYTKGLLVVLTYPVLSKDEYEEIRNESSIVLHKLLLQLERWLWEHNSPNAISFGAGSCKLCKNGCGKEKCNNPYMSRSPLEATGVNVIKSAGKYNIKVTFPADEKIMRIGLLLWQEETQ